MRLTKLSVENFLVFRGQHEFNLDHDATLLLGKSGSGKTAIQEAILYSLFNASPRTQAAGRGVSDLISKGKHELSVTLDLKKGKNAIRVFRKRNQSSEFYLEVNGNAERFGTLGAGVRRLSSLLEFPFSSSKFIPLIYFSHASLKEGISGEIEKAWLENLYKILKLRVKTRLKTLEAQVDDTKRELYKLEGQLAERKKRDLPPTKELENQMAKAALELERIKQTMQGSSSELDEMTVRREKINQRYYALRSTAEKDKALLDQDACPTCARPITPTLRETLEADFHSAQADMGALLKMSESLKESSAALRNAVSRLGNEKYGLESRMKSLSQDILDSQKTFAESYELEEEQKKKSEEKDQLEETVKAFLEVRSSLSDSYTELLRHIYESYIIPPVQRWSSILFYEPLRIEAKWTGRDIELRIHRKKESLPYALLSMGEKVRLQVSLKISIARFLSSLASSPLLLLDEIIDSLDLSAAEAVVSLLAEEAETSQQIIMTSHRKELASVFSGEQADLYVHEL